MGGLKIPRPARAVPVRVRQRVPAFTDSTLGQLPPPISVGANGLPAQLLSRTASPTGRNPSRRSPFLLGEARLVQRRR